METERRMNVLAGLTHGWHTPFKSEENTGNLNGTE
jgi:hypothetical protein